MFKKVLVANRGEIALRIIRALREMSVKSVIVYSEADRNTLPVELADDRICIGPARASKSYLNISQMISAAIVKKCDALHPGYGFLAENAHFAEICKSYGVTFIGPSPEAITLAGQKAAMVDKVKKGKVPVIPGSHSVCGSLKDAQNAASKVGFPVMIKAVAGGGGKGMRVARSREELADAFGVASSEAKAAFSNPGLYIEKFLESPRHIEIQIASDRAGRVIYFPERDCSIQRNHQKVLEESPSPKVSEKMRKKLGDAACRVARLLKYDSVGTVEFLVSKNNFYFMEMNARIQVEHPVSELVSDTDLVKLQIALAAGENLRLRQAGIGVHCAAIECRINSEDESFRPSTGVINRMIIPGGPGVRVDTALRQGDEITPFYDSMIAKIITYGRQRSEALTRMRRALYELNIEGVETNRLLHMKILENGNFQKGIYSTDFIQTLNGNGKNGNRPGSKNGK